MHLTNQEMTRASFALTVVGVSLLLATSSQAQCDSKFYIDAKTGVSLAQNPGLQVGPYGNSGDVKFDAGIRGDLSLGYKLPHSFAVEFETGVIWNSIHTIDPNTLSAIGASADLYQIPLLVNGIYNIPLHGKFKPYVGVGVGAEAGLFKGANIELTHFPGASLDYSDLDFTFAYQATLGFKYAAGKHVEIGLDYEFLGTTDHSWSDQNVPLKTDGTLSHSLLATFTWRF